MYWYDVVVQCVTCGAYSFTRNAPQSLVVVVRGEYVLDEFLKRQRPVPAVVIPEMRQTMNGARHSVSNGVSTGVCNGLSHGLSQVSALR